MKSLFDYENKFMQALMAVGDLIILNILFILFSLPIVTMGAAQAGLYTGVRVITDKEDDSSPAAGFVRGFKTGFFKITLMWIPFLFLVGLLRRAQHLDQGHRHHRFLYCGHLLDADRRIPFPV